MGSLSLWHWVIVLLIVLLVFGTKRLRGAGRDLGEAVKGFKKGMSEDDTPAAELRDESQRRDSASPSSSPSQHTTDAR